ncbi:MAG: endonuclease/exonuclease/phosphatase family protein [Bacteroidia bacterium]|nr:endonuclease/exonuclease/phosphatase family protein [Bacteroidia bacterium]MCZ2248039.1 endonuclease/exonuclease/phosphatase family protein [Bacteroidia bacterium]
MSISRKVIFFFNVMAIAVLLLCFISPYVSPGKFWPLSFFGLIYPLIFTINLIFVFYWLLRKSPIALLSGLLLAYSLFHYTVIFKFRWNDEIVDNSKNSIKVMSFNVRLFDLYNWSKNKETREKIFELIEKEKPDILAIQEFYADDVNDFININTLKQRFNLPYEDYEFTLSLRNIHHWGIATFSKFKIVGSGHVNFRLKSNNICIYSDLLIGKDTVRVYNMHLQSIHLGKEDYVFLKALGSEKADVDEYQGTRRIAGRLKRAFIKRAEQVDSVAKSIQDSPYAKIVCGDFNDTPISYTYRSLTRNLKDAFVTAGKGLGGTYNEFYPGYRIDYILYDNKFNAHNFVTHQEKLSDHNAISCIFTLNK